MTKEQKAYMLSILSEVREQITNEETRIRMEGLISALSYDPEELLDKEPNEENVAEHAKQKALNRVSNRFKPWIDAAMLELEKVARQNDTFTSDELRYLKPPIPQVMGAVFNRAAKIGLIVPVGIVPAKAEVSHGHYVRVWKLADERR